MKISKMYFKNNILIYRSLMMPFFCILYITNVTLDFGYIMQQAEMITTNDK